MRKPKETVVAAARCSGVNLALILAVSRPSAAAGMIAQSASAQAKLCARARIVNSEQGSVRELAERLYGERISAAVVDAVQFSAAADVGVAATAACDCQRPVEAGARAGRA